MSQHTWHVRVLTGQAVTPTSRSTLTGAELPQGEKVLHLCAQGYFVSVRLFITLQTGPARLLCQGGGFSRQEYWSVLANTGCHTLLEHCISCCPGRHLPHPPSTWCCQNRCDPSSCNTSTPGPHWGKPKSSKAASGAIPNGQSTCRGGNKTTAETQGQCG